MQQPLHTGRLVLTPEDPYLLPSDLTAVLAVLREIDFIGGAIPGMPMRHLLGEQFMQLVTFMGCSPYIALEPGCDGQPFCHLSVAGPFERPRLLQGKNTTPPRCAACRKRLGEWRGTMDRWNEVRPGWLAPCPHCGHRQDPATYDWRQSAGCGRLFLCVENIFPQEAIPAPALLSKLAGVSDQRPWRYFYQQEEAAQRSPQASGI